MTEREELLDLLAHHKVAVPRRVRRLMLTVLRETDKSPVPRALDPAHRCLDIERLAEALEAPGIFEDPLDDKTLMELAEDIVREYEASEER